MCRTSRGGSEATPTPTSTGPKFFIGIVGDKGANPLTPQDCIDYQELLKKWPKDYTSDKGSIRAYVKANPDQETINPVTRQRRNGRMIQFLRWCKAKPSKHAPYLHNEIYLDAMELTRTEREDNQDNDARHPFTHDQLIKMLSDKTWTRPQFTNDLHYWVPLIGLVTGMRGGEICQLWMSEIVATTESDSGYAILVEKDPRPKERHPSMTKDMEGLFITFPASAADGRLFMHFR